MFRKFFFKSAINSLRTPGFFARASTRFPCFGFSNLNKQEGSEEIMSVLKKVSFENGKNLVDQKYIVDLQIKDDGSVTILLKLDQNYRKIKALCHTELASVPWIKNLSINMAPKEQEVKFVKRGGLQGVKKIIAVSSCKGGVGKSTVAVNLAFSLLKLSKSVGIFDADIYGPSLPTLLGKESVVLESPEGKPKEIIPVDFEGVKAMSFGFAARNKKAVMRGPMVSSIVNQLVFQTNWGELDYLVVDMPPGTGDIQITLCQELKFDGAVIVTTPQKLSVVDVIKGVEMFDDLKVPTIATVENMSHFICEKCKELHYPFGKGYLHLLKDQFGIKNSWPIPICPEISKYSDMGSPTVLVLPTHHQITQIYSNLANNIVSELARLEKEDSKPPHVRYETGSSLVIVRKADGTEKKIKAFDLRNKCNCALCVDEFSGKKILESKNVNEDVFPYKIEPKGNYAVAVVWSDGHKSSIYPYDRLLSNDIPEFVKNKK